MRVALHTRVRRERIADYEAAHRRAPRELSDAIRAAGVHQWTIWRSDAELFHVIDCEDYARALARLENDPVNREWQERMAEYLDVAHDYSSSGADLTLPVVWQL